MADRKIRQRARLRRDLAQVPQVVFDEGRLGQVLLNLLVNAAEAIPPAHPDEHEVAVVTRHDRAKNRVVVEISDTGSGIAPEDQARVFEPFFTTKPVGSGIGLGLFVCHGIVTSLGGDNGTMVTAGMYLVPERVRRLSLPKNLTRLRDFLSWLVASGEPVFGIPIETVVDVDRGEDVPLAEALASAFQVNPTNRSSEEVT